MIRRNGEGCDLHCSSTGVFNLCEAILAAADLLIRLYLVGVSEGDGSVRVAYRTESDEGT